MGQTAMVETMPLVVDKGLLINGNGIMDFSIPPEIEHKRDQINRFVDERLIPLEADPTSYDDHENIREDLLASLRQETKAMGIWSLTMPRERGGGGLKLVDIAVLYQEMNRSIFGPVCFNAAAPDDGNMWVLNKLGSDEQKDKWLQPVIDGTVRSCIVMTEPAPGSGSDPSGMMKTTAKRDGDTWVISGHKWFITGGEGASHYILLARTSDDPRRGLTTFLFHKDQPGWSLVRRIPIMGPEEHGGHCELTFDGLEIHDSDRLGDVGHGMKVVQTRLAMARLTHCMRWTGMARRALEIGTDYIRDREAFGSKLIDRESIQLMMGDAALRLHISRLLVINAAWKLDQGDFARKEVSAAKVYVSEALHHAVDTAIQVCGARGYSKDTLLEWMYRYARQGRILDGASEVHKMVIAQQLFSDPKAFWQWDV